MFSVCVLVEPFCHWNSLIASSVEGASGSDPHLAFQPCHLHLKWLLTLSWISPAHSWLLTFARLWSPGDESQFLSTSTKISYPMTRLWSLTFSFFPILCTTYVGSKSQALPLWFNLNILYVCVLLLQLDSFFFKGEPMNFSLSFLAPDVIVYWINI